ncbi:MAG: S8 family serine peptidase, partial [Deltaproteobacteria bacterium]|nr:S8 family serine peptidase [Deltaproteobacteria bacterium]
MATPHVAGVAALLVSLGKTNAEIRSILTSTATDLGATGWDPQFGYGLIDAEAAVAACLNEAPVADIGGPYSGQVGVPISFDGSNSTDSDGTVVSYEWNFLDGSTDTGAIVSHAYSSVGGWIVVL